MTVLSLTPPYQVIGGGSGGKDSSSQVNRPSGMLSKNDGKIFNYNNIKISDWIYECYRVLKQNTHIYVMTNFLNLQPYMAEMQKAGFELHNLLIWEKNNATPNRWYMKNCEYIIFGRKGAAKSINNCGTKTVMRFSNVKDKIHPTEKPIELLKTLIENSTNPNDIVLDPFGGSFSTALACLMTGRKIISYEIDSEYYAKGRERLENFNPDDVVITSKVFIPSENQEKILEVLRAQPNKDFSGIELAELTGLSARTCSGCFTPLFSSGLIEKINNKSPYRVKIKEMEGRNNNDI